MIVKDLHKSQDLKHTLCCCDNAKVPKSIQKIPEYLKVPKGLKSTQNNETPKNIQENPETPKNTLKQQTKKHKNTKKHKKLDQGYLGMSDPCGSASPAAVQQLH